MKSMAASRDNDEHDLFVSWGHQGGGGDGGVAGGNGDFTVEEQLNNELAKYQVPFDEVYVSNGGNANGTAAGADRLAQLQRAVEGYRVAGFEVGPCDAIQKRPKYTWRNQDYRQRITLEMNVEQYGLENTGLCIFTGAGSGLTVIDFDSQEQKINALQEKLAVETDAKRQLNIQNEIDEIINSEPMYFKALEICEKSGASKVITQSGGFHFYFNYSADILSRAKLLPCVDARNDNAIIVAPPTIGAKGEYRWDDDKGDFRVRPAVPEQLLALFSTWQDDGAGMVVDASSAAPAKTSEFLIQDGEYIGPGQRDQRIFQHLLSRCGSGMGMEAAIAEVMNKNIAWDNEWHEAAVRMKAIHVYENYPATTTTATTALVKIEESLEEVEEIDYTNITKFRQHLNSVRAGEGKSFQIKSMVALSVFKLLQAMGQLLYDPASYTAYFFNSRTQQLIQISEGDFEFRLLASDLGVNPSDALFKFIAVAVWAEAIRAGTPIQVRTDYYYDRRNNILYMSQFNGRMVKIKGDDIEIVDNGTDGVLFAHDPKKQPFNYMPDATGLDTFNRYLVESVNFSGDGALTIEEMRTIFQKYILSIFFTGKHSDKPLMVLFGEKGSTKTTNGRNIGLVQYGAHFDVTPVATGREDDFDVTLINSKFVVLDNVDNRIKWLDDKLALASTGGTIKRRELYTTAGLREYPLECNILITTRSLKFCRDDVADRLIILNTARRTGGFKPKSELIAELLDNRDRIMSEIIHELQRIVGILDSAAGTVTTRFRMADFASFCLKIAAADGTQDQMEKIFDKLTEEQSRMTLETNEADFLDMLHIWVASDDNDGEYHTVNEICEKLNGIAVDRGVDFYYGRKPRVLASKMKDLLPNLKCFFNIDCGIGRGRTSTYKFNELG